MGYNNISYSYDTAVKVLRSPGWNTCYICQKKALQPKVPLAPMALPSIHDAKSLAFVSHSCV